MRKNTHLVMTWFIEKNPGHLYHADENQLIWELGSDMYFNLQVVNFHKTSKMTKI